MAKQKGTIITETYKYRRGCGGEEKIYRWNRHDYKFRRFCVTEKLSHLHHPFSELLQFVRLERENDEFKVLNTYLVKK